MQVRDHYNCKRCCSRNARSTGKKETTTSTTNTKQSKVTITVPTAATAETPSIATAKRTTETAPTTNWVTAALAATFYTPATAASATVTKPAAGPITSSNSFSAKRTAAIKPAELVAILTATKSSRHLFPPWSLCTWNVLRCRRYESCMRILSLHLILERTQAFKAHTF